MILYSFYQSPIGTIRIGCYDGCIQELFFEDSKGWIKQICKPSNCSTNTASKEQSKLQNEVNKQLDEYFNNIRRSFDLPLRIIGTNYQKSVWLQLTNIPFGSTISYRQLAIANGNKNHCRAVANANSKNPIALIVPCHRVVQSNGLIGGYAGDVWRKEWLINHEQQSITSIKA